MNASEAGFAPLCPGEIEHLDGKGDAPLHAPGLLEEGGRAKPAGEGHHEDTGGRDAAIGSGLLGGATQHLAIAHRTGSRAIAGPLGGDGLDRPAEAMASGIDSAISPAGTAMQKQLHQPAIGGLPQDRGNTNGRPIEITTTTGNDHHGTAMGRRWGQETMRRRRSRTCGPRREQMHRESDSEGIRKISGGAAAAQALYPLFKDTSTGVLGQSVKTPNHGRRNVSGGPGMRQGM